MFTDPIKNLKILGLREDSIVADLGAGTGFYSIALAHMVPRGKVYAVEVQKDFVATIINKVKAENLKNVEVFWGNIEKIGGTKLADNIADAVIASNVFFQIEDKNKFIEEVKRILKNSGVLLFIDWSYDSSLINANKMNLIPQDKVRAMFEKQGFVFNRDIDVGEHHYGMILNKNSK